MKRIPEQKKHIKTCFSYLELPKNNFDTTNGSLPDLTNWSLSPGPYGMESQQEDQASHHSSVKKFHRILNIKLNIFKNHLTP